MPEPARASLVVRFGTFELDLRSRELHKSGLRIKIQEQPSQVLAMLLEHPGEMVTREELRKKLWPEDTFVDFEHGLNAAINKLREALGDSADNPRFVETLPRRGYRFIYPVAVAAISDRRPAVGTPPLQAVGAIHESPLPTPTVGASVSRRMPLHTWGIVLAAALLLVIGGAIGYRHFRKPPAPPMRAVPFTSFPGREEDARFSPDGNQIAFAWDGEKEDNWDIYVKMIGEEKPLRLTTDPGEDWSPAWSPDGRHIAFCRALGYQGAIYVIPALGGPERKLVSSAAGYAGLDWSPDGKWLAFVDRRPGQQGGGIFLLAVDNPDDTRALTSPSGRVVLDVRPRFSPDGGSVAFTRYSSPGAAGDVHVVRVGGGEAKRLTFDNTSISGLDWTPDGAYIVFSSGRLGEARLWKVPASGGQPEPLAVGQGGALSPSLSRDGTRLAYTKRSAPRNIWRYEVPRVPGRSAPPTKLIASTQVQAGQQFSPDGKRIVFGSNRLGSWEIWVCDSDGSNPRQLTFFGGPMAGAPRWSPDGRQVAFDCDAGGNEDIYVVSVEGGRPHRLTTETTIETLPSWSRDGRWMYFASDRTGVWQVWKMPAEGGRAVEATKQGGFLAFESPDGKTLYYAKGVTVPGLWKVPVAGGEETSVLEQLAAGYWGYWGLTAQGIYFYNGSTKAVEFFSFATSKVTQVVKPEKGPWWDWPGFAVSPDGRWILFTQVDQDTSNIMLVENFRW